MVVGEALVIRSSELCFTRDETARYFATEAQLELTGPELELIYRQTDGWPAALQLFRLALRHPAIRSDLQRFRDYHPEAFNAYLAENVLRQQSAGAREFLLLSAVMGRMSGALCDEVLRRDGSEDLLFQFEAAGLFVRRMDSDPRWFTYHPLFANFLLDQLRPHVGDRIAVLRRRAADWFRRNGQMEDAVEHYVSAGDHAAAAEVLDEWADSLIPAAQLMRVERWSERIIPRLRARRRLQRARLRGDVVGRLRGRAPVVRPLARAERAFGRQLHLGRRRWAPRAARVACTGRSSCCSSRRWRTSGAIRNRARSNTCWKPCDSRRPAATCVRFSTKACSSNNSCAKKCRVLRRADASHCRIRISCGNSRGVWAARTTNRSSPRA